MKMTVQESGQRLDAWVAANVEGVNRSLAGKLCNGGKVQVNGAVKKASYKMREGDEVVVDFEQAESPPTIDIPIIYEDVDCVVLDKPAGVLTHSKGAHNPEATVATFIAPRVHDMDGERAGIVHRLDRLTSGVITCAKSAESYSWLQKQFAERKVQKTYVAVVQGDLQPEEAMIDLPIERNPKKPATFRVGPNGKPAQTKYKVLKHTNGTSTVELRPITGRTHQLRVHLQHLGHPILGDTLYKGHTADRLLLHAQALEIVLPSGEKKLFTSQLPKEFALYV